MPRAGDVLVLAIGLTLSGCGRRTSADLGTETSRDIPIVACRVTVPGVDVSSWREIAGEGFTFCVPPEWRGSGRTLRHRGAEITWGNGTPPPRQQVPFTVGVVGPAGTVRTPPSGPLPHSDVRRFTESIGGQRATVWRNHFGQAYDTGAHWESLRVWMVGEASDSASADLEVAIFRTARFKSS